MSGGYGSSGSSRYSTPSPRRSDDYLKPLTIQPKDPKTPYSSRQQPTCLQPPPSTTLAQPRTSSSSTRKSSTNYSPKPSSSSSGGRSSTVQPLSIHNRSQRPPDDVRRDKEDSRYYVNSSMDAGEPRKQKSGVRKGDDPRYLYDSAFFRD